MDNLATTLVNLLRDLLAVQENLLAIARSRQEAMRTSDVQMLNSLLERERLQLTLAEPLERTRRILIEKFRPFLGRGVEPTVSVIAEKVAEPTRTQLIVISAQLRGVVEQLDRATRINTKVSQAIVLSISKVLKVITGIAQHAGMYMANGRKAAMKGIHLLDAVG